MKQKILQKSCISEEGEDEDQKQKHDVVEDQEPKAEQHNHDHETNEEQGANSRPAAGHVDHDSQQKQQQNMQQQEEVNPDENRFTGDDEYSSRISGSSEATKEAANQNLHQDAAGPDSSGGSSPGQT
jgi:hypothetical protein